MKKFIPCNFHKNAEIKPEFCSQCKMKTPGRPKKPESEKKKRVSLSLPPEQEAYLQSMKHRSEYVENLIYDDMTRKGIV